MSFVSSHHLPDLNGLAALRAVVENGGVSAAARSLHVGQSAVTKRLRALESCYALPLTERVDGRLRLTTAGEKVYALAVQTLERQLAVQQELESMARGQYRLRLIATHDISEHFLPSLLMRFHESCPDCEIKIRVAYGQQIQQELIAGLANLALLENAPDHPEVLVQKWTDDELWLVCAPTHPRAGEESLPIEALADFAYVLRERGAVIRDTIEDAWKAAGLTCRVEIELGPTQALIDIIKQGNYASFLPRFAVEPQVKLGELKHIQVRDFAIQRSLWIARNRCDLKHPAAEAFIDLLRSLS